MTDREWFDLNNQIAGRVTRRWIPLAVVGGAGLLALLAVAVFDMARAWQAYWINYLFWMGLAQAGVILAALVYFTRGQWGGALVRLGLLQVAFLPVAVLLYVGIIIGAWFVLPWLHEDVHGKQWWLNIWFFLLRDSLAILALAATSLAFAYYMLRPEIGALREAGDTPYPAWLTRGWQGVRAERLRSERILLWLVPVLIILYAAVYTLLGFDMVMSLDPHWYSTLFGAYFFITTMYMGIAALVIVATIVRRRLAVEPHFASAQFHDLGKLMFAFCMLSGDFLWSQFLVIWYGDLPEENRFLLDRIRTQPWRTLSFIVLFGGFVLPFLILLNRRVKQIPLTLAAVALLILAVGFTERTLMILPSLPVGRIVPFVPEILISLGFAALYAMALLWALRHAPLVPAIPPHKRKQSGMLH